MITFTQNATFGQLYAEANTGGDWRIPTNKIAQFLDAAGLSLDDALQSPQWDTEALRGLLATFED